LSKWHSWSETTAQYRADETALISAKESVVKTIKNTPKKQKDKIAQHEVDRELLASMIGSTKYALEAIEKKLIYDLGTFSEAELESLTGQERQIASLKQRHTNRQVAEMLNISASHVQVVHKRVINKLKRIHSLNDRGIPPGLSRQQERIYYLHFKEKRAAPLIAKKLKISLESVQKQIQNLRKLV